MTSTTLQQLATLVGGSLTGDGAIEITGAAIIRDAGPSDITLADHEKLTGELETCIAAAVVVPTRFHPTGIAFIAVENVHEAFAKIVQIFRPELQRPRVGISAVAHISSKAKLGTDVDVYPAAYIEDDVEIGNGSTVHSGVRILSGCKIGKHVTIFPNAVIYDNTVIGDHCIIHANAVIGAYGFGYNTVDGRHELSAQLGNVEIRSHVEIGACSTIDRGTYGSTLIGEGTKIDNQVMVAHNCLIGRHNLLCSHVGIAGSCTTGDYVVMAGQVGIGDHVNIGDQAVVAAKSGVMADIPPGESHLGIPSTPLRQQMVMQAAFSRLPAIRKQLQKLERKVEGMNEKMESRSSREAA